jgi:hypothetical protein
MDAMGIRAVMDGYYVEEPNVLKAGTVARELQIRGTRGRRVARQFSSALGLLPASPSHCAACGQLK